MNKLAVMCQAATAAGAFQRQAQQPNLKRHSKGGADFATDIDLQSQELIVSQLQHAFPDIAYVAEEGDPVIASSSFFLVDPIDGTSDYANNGSNYGVIIGYVEDGQPQGGVIYQPARDNLVTVERGQGCFLNNQPVTLAHRKPLKETIVGTEVGWWCNASYFEDFLMPLSRQCQGLKSLLSSAGSTVELLEGKTGAYVNLGIPGQGAKLWDFVVGALAMEELGGVALAPNGSPLQWNTIPLQAVLAANADLGQALITFTKQWQY